MAGYAVSGFIDGFFRGRDWRDAKEDRKLDRERQKRLDELQLREFGLREQDFAMRKRAADLQYSEAEREIARRAEEQAFLEQMAASAPGAGGGMGVLPAGSGVDTSAYPVGVPQGQPMPAPVAPAMPSRTAAPAAPRLGFGGTTAPEVMFLQAGPAAPRLSFGAAAPAVDPTYPVGTPQGQPMPAAAGPATPSRPSVPASPRLGFGAAALTKPKETPAQPDRRATPPAQAGQPTFDAATGLPMAVTPPRAENLTPGKPPQGPNVAEEIAQGTAPARNFVLGGIDRTIGLGVGAAEAAVGGISAAAGAGASALGMSRAGQQLFDIAGQRFKDAGQLAQQGYIGANTAAAREAAAPQATETPSSPSAAAVSTLEQGAATNPATQQTAQATTAVAKQAALSFGVKPGEKLTPKQVKSAADATVDWFYQNAAPKLVEFYAARGEMDKAKAYVDLIESRAGKQALEERASGLFKIINGDIDGGFDDMLSAFKRYGYVDPTFDLDEEQTGVMRDENGGFAGIRMVFSDRATGDTMEKVFSSMDEAINYATVMTDPATMVEMMSPKPGQEAGAMNDSQKQIFDSAKIILESSKDGMGVATKTWEQALQEAAAGVAAVTGQVPSGLGTLGAGAAPAIDPRITGAGPDGLYRMQ